MSRSVAAVSLVILGAWCEAALATAPDASAAYDKEVIASCIQASGLRDARPAGEAANFDDRVGYTALIIKGRYPQPHMKNRSGRVLCLFERRSKISHVAPADTMIQRTGR